jgi:hypothetical protein
MRLSENDRMLLDRLIKGEDLFRRLRYVNLLLGVLCLLIAFGGFAILFFLSREKAMVFATHPMMYLLAVCGGVGIGWSIRGWKGHAGNGLLISLAKKLDGE